jgi:hypothetical protein
MLDRKVFELIKLKIVIFLFSHQNFDQKLKRKNKDHLEVFW